MDFSWSKNKVLYILIILIIIRVILVLLTANNIFPNIGIQPDLWMISIEWGGDLSGYIQDAQTLINGELSISWGFGFPFFLIPFIKIFGQNDINNIIRPIIIFNSIIIYSLLIILVYFLAKKILKNKNKSLFITSLYVIYPYLFYIFFDFLVPYNKIIQAWFISRFTHIMLFTPASDPLSTLLIISSLVLLFYHFKDNSKHSPYIFFLIGLLVSYAIATRLQNIIIAPLFFLILFLYRKYKQLLYFIIGGFWLLAGQLYLNYVRYGSVFTTIYHGNKGRDFDIPIVSLEYPLRIFTYPLNYSPLLFILVADLSDSRQT